MQVSTKKEAEGKIFGSEWWWRGVQILHPALICKAAARERDFVTTCHLCLLFCIFVTHNGESRYRLRKKFRKLVLYVLLQITDLKLQFQNVCFSVTGVPMELKAILLPTALRYFSSDRLLFQAQYSCLDGGKLVTSMVSGDPKYRGYQRDASLGGSSWSIFFEKYWVYEDKIELNARLDFIFCFATVLWHWYEMISLFTPFSYYCKYTKQSNLEFFPIVHSWEWIFAWSKKFVDP